MIRPTGRIVVALAAMILLGMIFGASLWLYAGYSAAGLVLASRYLAASWTRNVLITRRSGGLEVAVGSSTTIQITVRNQGRIPILWLLVEDLLPRSALIFQPPALDVHGERLRVLMLWPGQQHQIIYRLTCNRRGYFQIGPTVLETGDLFGLQRNYRVGAEPQFLLVLPRIVPLSGYEIASTRPVGEIKMRERFLDDPTRLQGIRDWQPGDAMKQIHWPATARTGLLHSKVYEPTAVAGVTLVLDFHRQANPRQHEPVRSELAVTAAASIAALIYEMNQPLGVVSNGRDAADRIRSDGWAGDYRTRAIAAQQASMANTSDRLRPVVQTAERGPSNFQDIQRLLARLELSDGLRLEELLIESEHRLARETTIVIITQSASEETTAALLQMGRRGWALAVILNVYDDELFSRTAGPLIGARIPVLQLKGEQQIGDICRQFAITR